jgi:hypothetical protein
MRVPGGIVTEVAEESPAAPASSQSASTRQKPRLLDIFKGDLRALHAHQTGRLGKLVDRVGGRLEKLDKKFVFRVMICPPLTLFHGLRGAPSTPANIIHRFYLHGLWAERTAAGKLKLVLGLLLISVPVNLFAILWWTAINRRVIGGRTGKSTLRLMREQLAMAFRHNIMSPWYFQFDLHDDVKRAQAGDYLQRFELKGGCYRVLKPQVDRALRKSLSDKEVFHRMCRESGLPTVPQIANVVDGEWRWETGVATVLPRVDLFIKPRSGRGGAGAERWNCAGSQWKSGDLLLNEEELVAHLKAYSLATPVVVQKRAVAHAAITDLSNGALPTARILTFRNEEGEHEPVGAAFRMAIGVNTVVDNFHAGGILAAVDLATGRLGRATDIGLTPDIGWIDAHPDTNAPIAGRILPLWAEVLALARRSHEVFKERVVVGWDIAILDEGPCLVEGNVAPDPDLHQRSSGKPLGRGRFGELMAYHLARRRLDLPSGLT